MSGLADTYFLFQLLGIPFTIMNVFLFTLLGFVIGVGFICYISSR